MFKMYTHVSYQSDSNSQNKYSLLQFILDIKLTLASFLRLKIVTFSFFLLPLHAGADNTTRSSYFVGSYEGARSSCEAFSASLNYGACAGGALWAGQTNWQGGSYCANGNANMSYCGQDPSEPVEWVFNHYYYPLYELADAYDKNQNKCNTIGNPIDPVTGEKTQEELLVELDSALPIELSLFYNSASLNRWSHNYNRRLLFSSEPTGSRFDLYDYGSANNYYPLAEPETPLLVGGMLTGYGKKNVAPVNTTNLYINKEEACEHGWGYQKGKYHYSWIDGSVAEYRLTPISGLSAIGQCYILDGVDGNVKMVLDIYELFSGTPSGYSPYQHGAPGIPEAGFLRFVRENDDAIVFRNFGGHENIHNTGETYEKITLGSVTTYRLHTANDTIEEYADDGRLLTITSPQGFVQTLVYDVDTNLLNQVLQPDRRKPDF